MSVRKVNFTRAREIYDEKYEEIFNMKNSKIHFGLFGDNEKDGVVDGAGDKWKNISFMDGLMTIANRKCPEGHRIKRRSFDHFKCTKYSFKMSTFVNDNNYSSNIKPITLNDLEIYDMPVQYQSAREFFKFLVPEYKVNMERGKTKMTKLFYFQLKELLPELVIDDTLSIKDKLDYLVAEVDNVNLFRYAIIKTIYISLGYDFILRHKEIIKESADSLENKSNETIFDDSFHESSRKKRKINHNDKITNKCLQLIQKSIDLKISHVYSSLLISP